ncbi:unnamed protein product [Eruca vesicaria subsp. sativa]|uniref:mRNA (guanine-N(7))-methyltransferase n=1 Tax=Eruca vesicaria subsp. sativa TaxID=29727 RepID=A0ABC8IVY1_ERUVS|nr:unnamed protein product [Eruca vesicaria subsp. sativa]
MDPVYKMDTRGVSTRWRVFGAAEHCADAKVIYKFLEVNEIGKTHALFYIAYAMHMDFKNAKPVEKFNDAYKKFMVRTMRRSKTADEVFAMHYSWTTEACTRRALANVSALLRPGGVFIGTMPDSNVIIEKLREAEGLEIGNSVYWIRFGEEHSQKLDTCFVTSVPKGDNFLFFLF